MNFCGIFMFTAQTSVLSLVSVVPSEEEHISPWRGKKLGAFPLFGLQ